MNRPGRRGTPARLAPAFATLLMAAAPLWAQATGAPPTAVPARPRANDAGSDPVAVLGALDKRLGTTAEFSLKPGERFSFGRLSGILRSCERTQPFERPQSAAFVQVVEQPPERVGQPAAAPATRFSGWLFAESPSLNPFMHPVYDVWLKSCTMRFPDGPKAPAASRAPTGKTKSAGRSKPAPVAAPEAAPVAAGAGAG